MALAFLLIFVFVVGASVGSFLNVAIARLPLEKSLLWPNSRCGACLQPIRWHDNLPLLSYVLLRGRCRTCGQHFSIAYFLVELGTALGFVALFWLEMVENVHRWPGHLTFSPRLGHYPWASYLGFAWHALLLSFLIAASICDLKSREIPLQLTLTGTLVGLIGSMFLPWPWPHALTPPPAPLTHHGIYNWPFWFPLPDWFEPGSNWQTGLATGMCGAMAGTFLLRAIGFIFSKGLGKEALGLGDADLMMMAGAFLGWQAVVVAFFLSVFPALLFGIILLAARNDNSLPFGPALALSVMATCLGWRWVPDVVRVFFFDATALIAIALLGGCALFVMSFLLRLIRGKEEQQT
ncbi:MAG: prepilin peptidase [Planctomycetes bacterium]|nr:prepilin peptidase [Planctomycetota bacterium]